MYDMQNIETKIDRIESYLTNRAISQEAKDEVRDILRDLEYELDLLRSEQEDILLSVLRDEDVDACECDRYNCPLKHGRIPKIVRYRTDQTLLSALREYERGHRGAKIVQAFRQRKSEMRQRITDALDNCLDLLESEL